MDNKYSKEEAQRLFFEVTTLPFKLLFSGIRILAGKSNSSTEKKRLHSDINEMRTDYAKEQRDFNREYDSISSDVSDMSEQELAREARQAMQKGELGKVKAISDEAKRRNH